METLYSMVSSTTHLHPSGPLYSVNAEASSISRIHRFAIQNHAEFH
jgi:hypothetical protein